MSAASEGGFARLFVAVELPDDWRAALLEVQQRQERASPGYFRWVAESALHVTVVFMGSQPRARVGAIGEAVRRAASGVPPFHLSLGALGTFGSQRAPRVLWAEALQPDGRLQQLRRALDAELRALGVAFDDKPLRPHVTLGRARRGGPTLLRLMSESLDLGPHRVDRIVLFESTLLPAGPRYGGVVAAPLGS